MLLPHLSAHLGSNGCYRQDYVERGFGDDVCRRIYRPAARIL